jgi:hypothetical protein
MRSLLAVALALALLSQASAQTPAASAYPDLQAALTRAGDDYEALLAARTASDRDLVEPLAMERRLRDDAALLAAPRAADWRTADWDETLHALVALDIELVAHLRGPRAFSLEPGLHAVLLRSAVDGTIDSVATYVPPGPRTPGSVALILHGNPQTETELLSQPYLRRLADETGTILVAPHGRGTYNYAGAATNDLYGIATMLRGLPELAGARFYLAGYSMGGFSVFRLGPGAPLGWDGVLAISGALVGSAAPPVLAHWRTTPIYVVFGDRDTNIPTKYGRDTALYLFQQAMRVGYYEQPAGTHYLRTLTPALRAAWLDMLRGVVRDDGIARLAEVPAFQLPPSAMPPGERVHF